MIKLKTMWGTFSKMRRGLTWRLIDMWERSLSSLSMSNELRWTTGDASILSNCPKEEFSSDWLSVSVGGNPLERGMLLPVLDLLNASNRSRRSQKLSVLGDLVVFGGVTVPVPLLGTKYWGKALPNEINKSSVCLKMYQKII